MKGFQKELEELINRHSLENDSNTPDFVLAAFMQRCLDAYTMATNRRDKWYGINPEPGWSSPDPVPSMHSELNENPQ